ncbi:MAG: hypothetical protein CMO81_09185 [Waddliaceae bacterium]|nr:hypothetical protein [Waddliaceae bacterium]
MSHTKDLFFIQKKQYLLLWAVFFSMFAHALEMTITLTLLPSFLGSFGRLELYPWILNSFLFTSVTMTPLWGRLTDLFGVKRVIFSGAIAYSLGVSVCVFAKTMPVFLLGRAFMGAGSGALVLANYTVLAVLSSHESLPRRDGMLSSSWAFASLAGPGIASFFLQTLHWRWAYVLLLPLVLIPLLVLAMQEGLDCPSSKKRGWDGQGLFLLAFSTLAALFLTEQLSSGAAWWICATLFLCTCTGFIYFVRASILTKDSVLPMHLFSQKGLRESLVMAVFAAAVLYCLTAFMPLFIQGVQGGSVAVAGWVTASVSLGWLLGSIIGGRYCNQWGAQKTLMVGVGFLLLGLGALLCIPAQISPLVLALLVASNGIGIGLLVNTNLVQGQRLATKTHIGGLTAGISLFRGMGAALGLAIGSTLQLRFFTKNLSALSFKQSEELWVEKILQSPDVLFGAETRLAMGELLHPITESLAQSIQGTLCGLFFLGVLLSYLLYRSGRT